MSPDDRGVQLGDRRDLPVPSSPRSGRRRARRWILWLGVVLAIVGVLLFSAPYWFSTALGRGLAAGIINDRIKGEVSLGRLSLSWLGKCEAGGVTVKDTVGREVLRVEQLKLSRGLLHFLRGGDDLGGIRLDALKAELRLDKERIPSLIEALQPVRPSGRRSLLPEGLTATVAVTDAEVVLLAREGKTLGFQHVNATVELNGPDDLTASTSGRLSTGGSFSADLQLNSTPAGEGPGSLRGSCELRCGQGESIPIGPLLGLLGWVGPELTGSAEADLSARLSGGQLQGDGSVALRGFRSVSPQGSATEPIDLRLTVGTATDGQTLALHGRIEGDAGDVRFAASHRVGEGSFQLSPEGLLAALTGGGTVGLPAGSVQLDGRLLPARIAQAAPSLVKVLPTVEVTGGELLLEDVALSGGSQPSAKGKIELRGLQAVRAGRELTPGPITAEFDARLDDQAGLRVEALNLRSAFASVVGRGSMDQFDARFQASLPRLHEELGGILDLDGLPRQGSFQGTVNLVRLDETEASLAIDVTADDLEVIHAGRTLRPGGVRVAYNGRVRLTGREVQQVAADKAVVEMEGLRLSLEDVSFDVAHRAVQLGFQCPLLDLPTAGRWLDVLGAAGMPRLAGRVRAAGDFQLTADGLAELSVRDGEVRGLRQLDRPGGEDLSETRRGLDLTFAGEVRSGRDEISWDIDVAGDAAEVRTTGRYPRRWPAETLDMEAILASIRSGKATALPEGRMRLHGRADFGRIRSALRGLLGRPGQFELLGGALTVDSFELAGGRKSSLKARIRASDLVLLTPRQRLEEPEANATIDVRRTEGGRLRVDKLLLEGAFGSVELAGDIQRMRGRVSANLFAARDRLAAFAELDQTEASGQLVCELELSGLDSEQVGVAIDLTGRDVRIARGRRTVLIDEGRAEAAGAVTLDGLRPRKLALSNAAVELPCELAGTLKGSYERPGGPFELTVQLDQADLSALSRYARDFAGASGPGRSVAGRLALHATLSGRGRGEELQTTGRATVKAFALEDRMLGAGDVSLEWSGVRIDRTQSRIRAERAELKAPFAEAVLTNARFDWTAPFCPEGEVQIEADMGPVRDVAEAFGLAELPPVRGKLSYVGSYAPDGEEIVLRGQLRARNVEVVSAEDLSQQDVSVDYEASLIPAAKRLDVRMFSMTSDVLRCALSGRIEDMGDVWQPDLAGTYSGSWESMMPWIYHFWPSGRDHVVLLGRTAGEIRIAGPVRAPDARPAYRDLEARAQVGWDRAEILGVRCGSVKLAPTLQQAQLTIPPTEAEAADGTIRLGGVIDLREAYPVYRRPGEVRLLEGVAVDERLGRRLLSWFNPIFADLASVQGRVTLDTSDLVLPLAGEHMDRASGRGRVDMTQVSVRPDGLLGNLLLILGRQYHRGQRVEMRISDVNFTIRDGRIDYDDFTVAVGDDLDLVFLGSVGFDGTVDMAVSVPVTAALLERFGVGGRVLEIARILSGARLEIPIAGTRRAPRLDLSKVDVRSLVIRALMNLAAEQDGPGLFDLLPMGPGREPVER